MLEAWYDLQEVMMWWCYEESQALRIVSNELVSQLESEILQDSSNFDEGTLLISATQDSTPTVGLPCHIILT